MNLKGVGAFWRECIGKESGRSSMDASARGRGVLGVI